MALSRDERVHTTYLSLMRGRSERFICRTACAATLIDLMANTAQKPNVDLAAAAARKDLKRQREKVFVFEFQCNKNAFYRIFELQSEAIMAAACA